MSERKQALVELRDQVKAGDFPTTWEKINKAGLAHNSHGLDMRGLAWDAFNGSLNAAKALHEAVLPEWTLDEFGQRAGGWIATLGRQDGLTPRPAPRAMVRDNPARAWLIAILEALIVKENADDK